MVIFTFRGGMTLVFNKVFTTFMCLKLAHPSIVYHSYKTKKRMYYDTNSLRRHSERLEGFEWDRGWCSVEATNPDKKYS